MRQYEISLIGEGFNIRERVTATHVQHAIVRVLQRHPLTNRPNTVVSACRITIGGIHYFIMRRRTLGSLPFLKPKNFQTPKIENKMEKFEIEKDRVLAAAAKCPDAKKILETLFPEAFNVRSVTIPYEALGARQRIKDSSGACVAEVLHSYAGGRLKEKALLLTGLYEWSFETLSCGAVLAIPSKKDRS